MEPLLIILVPGVLGGLVLALLIAGNRQAPPSTFVPRRLAAPSPALINMAHIQVEGIGGLGMVAAVVAVAVADSRIRLATIVASVLGAGLALVLIAVRRRTGALSSSDNGPGRSTLRLDGERRIESGSPRRRSEAPGARRSGGGHLPGNPSIGHVVYMPGASSFSARTIRFRRGAALT
jgi:hypothetical protein